MDSSPAKSANWLQELHETLAQLANLQFESEQYRRLLSLKLNRERARQYVIQRTHWTVNRRDCWALVQGIAPMDVKRILWEHEREELAGDKERGVDDHHTLSLKEGGSLGLAPEDFVRNEPIDGCVACCQAWRYLASHSHWLGALAASAALELANSDEVIKGGSMSRRMGIKFRDEVGIPLAQQHSNAEHMVADVRHAHLLFEIAAEHAKTPWDREEILRGAKASWAIDRVWKGQLADLVARIPV